MKKTHLFLHKIIVIFVIATITLLPISSCTTNSKSALQVLNSIISSLEDAGYPLPPASYLYTYDAVDGTRSYLSVPLSSLLYYGNKNTNVRELDLLSDFAIRLSDDLSACEIHVFLAKNPTGRDKLAELLNSRLEMLKASDIYMFIPDNYELYIASGEVVIKGDFVILLITADNECAKKGI